MECRILLVKIFIWDLLLDNKSLIKWNFIGDLFCSIFFEFIWWYEFYVLVCVFGKGFLFKLFIFIIFCKVNFYFIYVFDFCFNEDVIGNMVVVVCVVLMEIRGFWEGEVFCCVKIDWDDCMERGVMVKIGGVFIGGISIVLCSVFLVSNWFGWVV